MTPDAYWRANDAEDNQLDGILAGIRSQEDAHLITVRQAADARVRALENHLAAVQELQGATAPRIPHPGPGRPSCNPYGVVRLVTAELAADRVKTRYSAEANLTAAVGHAAQMLNALGVAPVIPPDGNGDAPVQRRGMHECTEFGGVGTAPTHRAGCPLAGESA